MFAGSSQPSTLAPRPVYRTAVNIHITFNQRQLTDPYSPSRSFLPLNTTAAVLVALVAIGIHEPASGQVVFSENFASPSSTTWNYGSDVQINTSPWRVYTTAQHGARITGGRLEITDRRSSSTGHGQGFAHVPCGGSGSLFDVAYSSTLQNNGGMVTWTFNMRKSYSSNGGFSCSSPVVT